MPALLELSSSNQQGVDVAAAVQLGILVETHWKFVSEDQAKNITLAGFQFVILSEEDKQIIRDNIVVKMYHQTNRAIIKQYLRAITTIARMDYPSKWQSLLTRDIAQALGTKEDQATLTGLMALFCVCKKYEFETESCREELFTIVKDSHEHLGSIIETYLPQI